MRISDWSSDVCSSDLGPTSGHGVLIRPLIEGEFTMDDLDHNLSTEHQREGDARRPKDTLDRDRTGGIPNREKSEPFVGDDEQEQEEERADMEELQTGDRKRTRLNSSHYCASRMPSSACK